MKSSMSEDLPLTFRNLQTTDGASNLDLGVPEEVDEAINAGNVFCILGANALVRDALRKRGWIELFFNFPKKRLPRRIPHRLKLLGVCDDAKDSETLFDKITASAYRHKLPMAPSYLRFNPFISVSVSDKKIVIPWEDEGGKYARIARKACNCSPRLIWVSRFFQVDLHCQQLKDCYINVFSDSTSICNKAGICRVLKRLPSILNEDPSTFFPRSYNLACEDERQDFIDDFRKTACVSVVRYIIESRNNRNKHQFPVDPVQRSDIRSSCLSQMNGDCPTPCPTSDNEEIDKKSKDMVNVISREDTDIIAKAIDSVRDFIETDAFSQFKDSNIRNMVKEIDTKHEVDKSDTQTEVKDSNSQNEVQELDFKIDVKEMDSSNKMNQFISQTEVKGLDLENDMNEEDLQSEVIEKEKQSRDRSTNTPAEVKSTSVDKSTNTSTVCDGMNIADVNDAKKSTVDMATNTTYLDWETDVPDSTKPVDKSDPEKSVDVSSVTKTTNKISTAKVLPSTANQSNMVKSSDQSSVVKMSDISQLDKSADKPDLVKSQEKSNMAKISDKSQADKPDLVKSQEKSNMVKISDKSQADKSDLHIVKSQEKPSVAKICDKSQLDKSADKSGITKSQELCKSSMAKVSDKSQADKWADKWSVPKSPDKPSVAKAPDKSNVSKVVNKSNSNKVADKPNVDKSNDKWNPNRLADKINVEKASSKSNLDTVTNELNLDQIVERSRAVKADISTYVAKATLALKDSKVGEGGDGARHQTNNPKAKPKIVPKIQYEEVKATTPMPLNFIKFALHQCHKMLETPTHSEIDGEPDPDELSKDEWDTFLHHFYQLSRYSINYTEMSDIVDECEALLQELKTHRQQFVIDGYKNIWIMKPKGSSRGRGIFCYNNIEQVLQHIVPSNISDVFGNKLMVQKYVERPLLIYNTKVDIRQYFLVTDWNRLTVWWYNDFYLRFCSQQFTLQDFNKSVHVSNHSIQMRYKNGTRSPLLPEENMWDRENFYKWLTDRGDFKKWKSETVPAMKNSILAVLRCGQENFTNPRRKSFQLYGADFIIDEDYKPWLLEINAMPALVRSTAVAGRIAHNVVEDTLKIIFDKGSKKDTGQFILLYRQPPFTPCSQTSCEGLQVMGRSIRVPPTVNTGRKLDIPEPPDSPCSNRVYAKSPEMPLKVTLKNLNPVQMPRKGHVYAIPRMKVAVHRPSEKKRCNVGSHPNRSEFFKRKAASDLQVVANMKSTAATATAALPVRQAENKTPKKFIHSGRVQEFGKIKGIALKISKISGVSRLNTALNTSPPETVESLLWIRNLKSVLLSSRNN